MTIKLEQHDYKGIYITEITILLMAAKVQYFSDSAP